jgi:hypothetical protein
MRSRALLIAFLVAAAAAARSTAKAIKNNDDA